MFHRTVLSSKNQLITYQETQQNILEDTFSNTAQILQADETWLIQHHIPLLHTNICGHKSDCIIKDDHD